MDTLITSLQNLKVKEAAKLRERRARKQNDLFLIEGYRELLRALDSGGTVQTLFYCPELFFGTNKRELIKRCPFSLERSND